VLLPYFLIISLVRILYYRIISHHLFGLGGIE